MKPKKCYYCDEVLEHGKFYSHIEMCGSKTFVCPDCKSNVLRKYTQTHKNGEC